MSACPEHGRTSLTVVLNFQGTTGLLKLIILKTISCLGVRRTKLYFIFNDDLAQMKWYVCINIYLCIWKFVQNNLQTSTHKTYNYTMWKFNMPIFNMEYRSIVICTHVCFHWKRSNLVQRQRICANFQIGFAHLDLLFIYIYSQVESLAIGYDCDKMEIQIYCYTISYEDIRILMWFLVKCISRKFSNLLI